jgi:Nif-specific regulatory protein
VDCGTLTKDLAGSELFGHKKGAFTDAKDDKVGLFEQANGGTLFLDEVTNLSGDVQAKLLRVLQEGRVRRIGENRERKVDVRVIAASNRDLAREVAEGRFRKDLYYRLKGLTVHLAPLRHRREDIPLLVHYFAEKFSQGKKKEITEISERAMRVMMLYDWEGNVRELENEMERAVVLMEEGRIVPELFSFTKRRGASSRRNTYSLDDLVKALEASNWVKRKAARMLDIPESTLRKRLKTHGITVPPDVRSNRTHL